MNDFRGIVRCSRREGFSRARLRLRIIRLRIALRRLRRSQRLTRASALGLVALFAAGAGVVLGCGWTSSSQSVRFNGWHTEREFSRLPPLPFDARSTKRADNAMEDEGESADSLGVKAGAIWMRAEEAEQKGDMPQTRKLLDAYLKLTDSGSCAELFGDSSNCQRRRNAARDRLDAVASLERGASAQAVALYLEARRAFDNWMGAKEGAKYDREKSVDEKLDALRDGEAEPEPTTAAASEIEAVRAALERVPRDRNLDDGVAYLRAAVLFHGGESEEAVKAFGDFAARYPQSEKREAALFTLGMLRMKASRSFTGEYATAEDACPDCRDEDWEKASAAFSRVLRDYPRGLYGRDARGWLAYLHLRVGQTAEGLVEYYRMLADESDAAARDEAVRSLSLARRVATGEDMERVEELIEGEPRVALAYAYHNVYNFALRQMPHIEISDEDNPYSYYKDKYEDENQRLYYDWEQTERDRRGDRAERKELARVASFATRLMRRRPGADLGGSFALRVAEANVELGENKAALAFAVRALASGLEGNERASALWVKGVAEHRTSDLKATRQTFAQLVKEFPEGDLTEGARRFLAMAAEDAGDLDAALEQYLALGYEDDVAYFVDALMSPDQLAAFVEKRSDAAHRDYLFYALGVRYLRAWRFDDARRALSQVRTTPRRAYDSPAYYSYDSWNSDVRKERDPKTVSYYEYETRTPTFELNGIPSDWVLRDLQTIADLERLQSEADRVVNYEERAEALYQLASYVFEGSDLKFYNPAAWRGIRERILVNYEEAHYRAPNEAQALWQYMQEHETPARALNIYLEVVRLYPNSRAARDALYSAAVCQQHLSNFNEYWRQAYGRGLHAGARLVTYEDVRRAYPGYRLPNGTNGWEPSTRTVDGSPAWPAPPRPKRLTGTERVRLKVRRAERRVVEAWRLFGEIGGGRVRRWALTGLRWLVVALIASGLLLVFRLTRRTRRFLYRQLARRRAVGAGEAYAPKSSYAAHLPYTWGVSLSDASGEVAHRLFQLAAHERGRAALVLNLFTHGLLTVLLWAVLWAAKG
ncbi:MAG: outer membrane protein assembly factor BamD [Rubrivivax sp.]|nr:outer membrane protein assembly factor BamD [Pyrinomonadaceae bacterium]